MTGRCAPSHVRRTPRHQIDTGCKIQTSFRFRTHQAPGAAANSAGLVRWTSYRHQPPRRRPCSARDTGDRHGPSTHLPHCVNVALRIYMWVKERSWPVPMLPVPAARSQFHAQLSADFKARRLRGSRAALRRTIQPYEGQVRPCRRGGDLLVACSHSSESSHRTNTSAAPRSTITSAAARSTTTNQPIPGTGAKVPPRDLLSAHSAPINSPLFGTLLAPPARSSAPPTVGRSQRPAETVPPTRSRYRRTRWCSTRRSRSLLSNASTVPRS
jgi:hypothetical protein